MNRLTQACSQNGLQTDSEGEKSGGPAGSGPGVRPDEDCSDDCCLNVVPQVEVEVPPALHQKPLPSFYIERLLEPAPPNAHQSAEDPAGQGPRDSSTVASSSSHRSSPTSAGRMSPASERDWCVSPCSPRQAPALDGAEPGWRMSSPGMAGKATGQHPPTAATSHDQSVPRSTAATRNVNAVFIAWPEMEARGVNFNRLQRELMSHTGLLSYGSWLPERGASALHDFQSQQLDLALASTSDGQYFNVQGSALGKRYRKQNRERKPRQAYSAMQLERLEDEFKRSIYLNVSKRFELAQCLGLSETQIKTWFQNRRTKFKKQQDSRNKREQRQHAQLIAQWLLQPQLCSDGNSGQFHPGARLPVLLPPRPLLQPSTLMPSPYMLPAPLVVQQRPHRAAFLESRRVPVPITVRSPTGPTAALPVPASFPMRILAPASCGVAASDRGLPETDASKQQDQC